MILRALDELTAPSANDSLKHSNDSKCQTWVDSALKRVTRPLVNFYEWRWEFKIASAVIKLPTVVMYLYNSL